jgi:hypothetical protein
VTDSPVSRWSYLITNRGPAASSSQSSSSHQSIEDSAPPISRIAGSAGSPKVWTQRSTPLAVSRFGRERRTFLSDRLDLMRLGTSSEGLRKSNFFLR